MYSSSYCTHVVNEHVPKDEHRDIQFTVLTDRSHGGSSLTDGSLEIMVWLLATSKCHIMSYSINVVAQAFVTWR